MPDRPEAGAGARLRHRPSGSGKTGDRMRDALATLEAQRDDAIVYLGAIREIMDTVARGSEIATCGQAIATALLRQLALETCAVVLHEPGQTELRIAGFATAAERFGGPSGTLDETSWVALAQLVGPVGGATCFEREANGGFAAVPMTVVEGESFLVLPVSLSGENAGALVLHSLVPAPYALGRERALELLVEIVGHALTTARVRESLTTLCRDLREELGQVTPPAAEEPATPRANDLTVGDLTHTLIRSNRDKREFLGTASHELRTPLNAILGYSSLVREGACGELNDEQERLLDRVVDNTRHLTLLIDDILFFVQLDTGRVVVHPREVEVSSIIEEVVSATPFARMRHEVDFSVTVAPEVRTLHVDDVLLRRLLFHLIGNAFKFTRKGAIEVRVEPGEAVGAALIVVRDTGVGMDPAHVQELFEPFSQGDSSLTRRYDGLGIGLALVRRCVDLLGGQVTVTSEPEKGTVFHVMIPNVLAPSPDSPDIRIETVH